MMTDIDKALGRLRNRHLSETPHFPKDVETCVVCVSLSSVMAELARLREELAAYDGTDRRNLWDENARLRAERDEAVAALREIADAHEHGAECFTNYNDPTTEACGIPRQSSRAIARAALARLAPKEPTDD